MTDKRKLRAEIRAARAEYVAGLSAADRDRHLAMLRDRVLSRLPAQGIVSAYSAYGDEIDPAPIAAALAGRIALPYFGDRAAPMSFRLWDGGELEGGPFDIPQPPASATEVEPDIWLVPLIAADALCHRLGQGRGHYDTALDRMATRKAIHSIGLAWDVQIIDEVPVDPWDMPLDAVATPTRWLTQGA